MSIARKLAPGSVLRIRSWRYRMTDHDLRPARRTGRRSQRRGVIPCRIQPRSVIMSIRNRASGHPRRVTHWKTWPAITPVNPAGSRVRPRRHERRRAHRA